MVHLLLNTSTKLIITLGMMFALSVYSYSVHATKPCQLAGNLHNEAKDNKDIEQQINGFLQALKHCETFDSRYFLGKAYLKKADYPSALNTFRQALTNTGENKKQEAKTLAHIAYIHFQLQQYQRAQNNINKALKLSKKKPQWMLDIAQPIQLAFSTHTVSAEQIVQTLSTKGNYSPEAVVPVRVGFAFDSAQLTLQGREQTEEMIKALRELPFEQHILLIGHTDERGQAEYNLKLSKERAKSVYEYMVSAETSAKYRVCFDGQGKQQPIIKQAKDEQKHAINRRVEIKTIASCVDR